MCQFLAGWGGVSVPSGVVCQLLAGWGGVSAPSRVGWCVSS